MHQVLRRQYLTFFNPPNESIYAHSLQLLRGRTRIQTQVCEEAKLMLFISTERCLNRRAIGDRLKEPRGAQLGM